MGDKVIPLALILVVYGLFLWIIYLMLARPVEFIERFVTRVYSRWGLQVTISDHEQLRRAARRFGIFMLIFVGVHATVVVTAILKSQ